MRIGVFSDVHGNLEALEACLQTLQEAGAEKYIQCGDLIGYGPDAQDCVDRVCQLPLLASVMGNHDAVLAFPSLSNLFNYEAIQSLEESLPNLAPDAASYLRALAATVQGENFTVVHGSPMDPIKEYFHSADQFYGYYHMWQGQILFVGHTHLQFYMKGTASTCEMCLTEAPRQTLSLEEDCRYVINPGAAGKPRDHNPAAACGLWDTDQRSFTFFRCPYNFLTTQEKMRQKGYPEYLIESLAYGL